MSLKGKEGKWNNIGCTEKRPYVCSMWKGESILISPRFINCDYKVAFSFLSVILENVDVLMFKSRLYIPQGLKKTDV